jgi:uncharacterized protein (TIGR00299 family) protein
VTRIAYLDCLAGISGDMTLGALIDAGAPQHVLDDVVGALGLHDVKVEVERTERGGIRATVVRIVEPAATDARHATELLEIVDRADLSAAVRTPALETLRRLVDAECEIHGVSPAELVVHELGGLDTVVDVVGAFALFDALGVDQIVSSPIPYGRGIIETRHGPIPGPGPAVVSLLSDGARMVGTQADAELVTPTGAAIVAVAAGAFGELPEMTIEGVGYGAGARDLRDRPNVLRVIVGRSVAGRTDADTVAPRRDAILLEAHVDDLLPELVPDVLEACREAGALDVWTSPVQMKKGRPGLVLSAVVRPDAEPAVVRALLTHATTLGVRSVPIRRYELDRETRTVDVDGHSIRVKVGFLDGRVVNVAPEHDDCARVAAELGRPVKQVWATALGRASELVGPDAGAR